MYIGFPGGAMVTNLPANAGRAQDAGSIPGLGRSPGRGNGNLLQYFLPRKFHDRGAWQATVHGVTKSRTQLINWAHIHMIEFLKNHSCVAVLNWNSSSMIFFLWSWERASYFKNTYAHTSWSHMEILFMQIEVWFSPNFPQGAHYLQQNLQKNPLSLKVIPWLGF